MKHLIITLFCCLPANLLFAQNLLKEKEFINQVITESNIFYEDSVSKYAAIRLRDHLKYARGNVVEKYDPDSVIFIYNTGQEARMLRSAAIALMSLGMQNDFRGRSMPIVRDTIKLSAAEIAYVLAEFDERSKRKWDEDLIPGARQLPKDTINAVFKDFVFGWDKMYKRGVKYFYSFGPPVFIRDNNYCIFYWDKSCGYTCGEGKLVVYKKEGDKWVLFGNITGWIS